MAFRLIFVLAMLCGLCSVNAQLFFVRPFATVADLVASNPNNPHSTVQVNGLTSEGDGGGGRWKWYAGDTTATNTSSIFASTFIGAPVGRWKKVNDTPASAPPDLSGFITNYTVITVGTIAELQSVNVSNGVQLVAVEGYYDRDDGGGGNFVYKPSLTDAADGGIVFAPNNGSGKWKRITDPQGGVRVPWWGAVTNETMAAAIDYASGHTNARTVIVPGGLYQIDGSKPVTVKSNVRIVGDAGASLVIAPNPTTNYQMFKFETGATNVSIANLDFQGWPNAPGISANFGRAWTVAGVTNLSWFGCSFTNFWSAPVKMGTNDYADVVASDRYGVKSSVLAFGATKEDGNNDTQAMTEAVLWARNSLDRELIFPSGHYWSTANDEVGNITLTLNDAFLYDWRLTITSTNSTKVTGGRFRYYNDPDVTEIVSMTGAHNVWFDKVDFYYHAEVTGTNGVGTVDNRDKIAWTCFDIAGNSRNIKITGCNLDIPLRACVIILGAEDVLISGCRMHSVDDGVSVKAAAAPSKNIIVSQCYYTNSATLFGIGTEIAYPVSDIMMTDIIGENVSTALNVKPGNRFYNSNMVRGVTFNNIKISDTNGLRYQHAMSLAVYAGTVVSDILYRNIDINARCATNSEPRAFGDFRAQATPQVIEQGTITNLTRSGSTATALTSTDFVKVGWTVVISGADQTEYNGTNVVTSAGVGTFTYTVSGTPASPATGTITVKRDYASMVPNIRNVRFENVYGRSPTTGGGYPVEWGFHFLPFEGAIMTNITAVNCYFEGIDGPPIFARNFYDTNYPTGVFNDFTIDGLTARDHNKVSTSTAAVIINGDAKAKLNRIDVQRPSALSAGVPALFVRTNSTVTGARGAGTLGKFYKGKNQSQRVVWRAPERSWVHSIYLLSPASIPQHASDYLTFSFRNVDTGQIIETNNTSSTGLNLVANTMVKVNTTNIYTGAEFAKNSPMLLDITHVGAGRDVDDLTVVVDYVPFEGGISSGGGQHGPQDLSVIQPQLTVRGSGAPQVIVESTSGSPESRISFADSIGATPAAYVARDGVGNRFNLVAGASSQELGLYAAGTMIFAPGFQTQRGKWFTGGGLAINAAADTADPGAYRLATRAGNSTAQQVVGGTLYSDWVAVGNVGAGEDDLKTRSLVASILNDTYDTIYFEMPHTFASNANSKRVRVYFGTALLWDSGAQNQNGGSITVCGRVTRMSSATTQKAVAWAKVSSGSLFTESNTYTTPTETLTGAITIKATGEGVADNDIQQQGLLVLRHPLH